MPERHLLLTYDYVPDILERRGPLREEHLALIARHRDAGFLMMAGAVGDPPRGALFVFSGGADPEAFVREDPYERHGLVTGWRVEPWAVV